MYVEEKICSSKYVTNHHNQSRYSTVFTAKVVSTVPHLQTHKSIKIMETARVLLREPLD